MDSFMQKIMIFCLWMMVMFIGFSTTQQNRKSHFPFYIIFHTMNDANVLFLKCIQKCIGLGNVKMKACPFLTKQALNDRIHLKCEVKLTMMEQPSYTELLQEVLLLQKGVATLGETCLSSIAILRIYQEAIDDRTITEKELHLMFSLMDELKAAAIQFDHAISSPYLSPHLEKKLTKTNVMSSSLASFYISIEQSLKTYETYKKKKNRFSKEQMLKWINK